MLRDIWRPTVPDIVLIHHKASINQHLSRRISKFYQCESPREAKFHVYFQYEFNFYWRHQFAEQGFKLRSALIWMLGHRSVSRYNQVSTTENKAKNALLLNIVASRYDDVRNICGFSNDASTGWLQYRSQGQNKHETKPLIQPNKKSLWMRTETLASRNPHAAINVGCGYMAFCISGCNPGTGHLKWFFTTPFTVISTLW